MAGPCIWSQRLAVISRLAITGFYMQGDSGGPLYLVSEAGVHKQIGITSFGSSLGCEIGMHAGFTR